jgi:hypothetical protein
MRTTRALDIEPAAMRRPRSSHKSTMRTMNAGLQPAPSGRVNPVGVKVA